MLALPLPVSLTHVCTLHRKTCIRDMCYALSHEKAYTMKLLKSRWVLFRAVILSHKICTYPSPVNFHVIHNFSSSRKTKKKHTEYKSYFKARISITYKVFIWRTISKNIIQPGRTPAVHLPQAPSPNIHFIHHGPKRSDSIDLSQCSHFHERVHVHTDTYTHTVFVGHSPHVVSSVQYNWARGKEPKLNL